MVNETAVAPLISVIIPTYNRPCQMVTTLESLACQTFPAESFEVIVIDDGSVVSYNCLNDHPWPFALRYWRQDNQGEIVARNLGVQYSQGDFFIFLDDDIIVGPEYIEILYNEHLSYPESVVIGALYPKIDSKPSYFQKIMAGRGDELSCGEVPFTECTSGVLAVSSRIYHSIGGMRSLCDDGRNAWGGMDFAYRAHLVGHSTRRCGQAFAYHDDFALANLKIYCNRMRKVSRLAVLHFQRCTDLINSVPMFHDKTPINYHHDSLRLIIKKFIRGIVSTKPLLWLLEKLIKWMEHLFPSPRLLYRLYRWIIGGYIYIGFRDGLRDYGPIGL